MSALENGNSAFEKRSQEAMDRRKVPAESGPAIQLPDLSKHQQTSPEVNGEQKPEDPDRKFLTILPGEVPEAPDGGDYVTDPDADMATPGAFAYKGLKIRPVTPEEYAEINAITADPKLRKEKGPRRLDDLFTNLQVDRPSVSAETNATSRGIDNRPEQPVRHGPTGPRISPQAGEPDLRDDLDRHRDDFADDHRAREAPPEQPPAGGSGENSGNEQSLVGARDPQGPEIALPSFYKRRERDAILLAPAQKDAPTLDVILQDPKKQELFGEFLKLSGKEDLAVRFKEKPEEMTPAEVGALRALRLEFGNRIALAEEASSYLQQEDVSAMLKNPAFGLFADTLRPERALQVIKDRGIPLLFIRESNETLNHMILSQRALQGIRSGPRQKYYANLRERVMRRAGTSARPEHLDPRVMGHVLDKSMLEWLTFRGPSNRHIETLNDITHNIASVSDILAASISSDPQMVRDAAREADSGKPVPALGGMGEGSYKEMERKENSYKLAEEQQAFNAFKQNLRARRIDTNNLSPSDERKYFNDFAEQREAAHGRGGERRGWFSILLDAFFSTFLVQNREQFKFKGA